MIVKFDLSDFERQAKRFGAMADQIPFALAGALNDAAEKTRGDLIDKTWPSHVQVRNKSFLKAALTTKGERATKKNLRVAIYDKMGRASLLAHAKGGTKSPRKSNLAIPAGNNVGYKRTGKGIPKNLRPLALPNSFVTDGRRPNWHLEQNAIYQRQGSYRAAGTRRSDTGKVRKKAADFRTVKLMYTLKPSATIHADVPFEADFERSMRSEVSKAFAPRLAAAMKTRRPKR